MVKNKKIEFEVGDKALMIVGDIKFEVKVMAIKSSYGRTRYLVTPVAGVGEQVVEILAPIELKKSV